MGKKAEPFILGLRCHDNAKGRGAHIGNAVYVGFKANKGGYIRVDASAPPEVLAAVKALDAYKDQCWLEYKAANR